MVPFQSNVEKYCIAEQGADDNAVHALCVLDNKSYRQTKNM